MLKEAEIKCLMAVFSAFSEIEAVYLFGSAVSGKRTIRSDIDLGIVYNDPCITERKINLYTDLVKAGFENTDIVFFNSADLVLQFEIIRHNALIYRKERFDHGELFSKTIRKYFDFKPYLDRQRRAYKKRILNG